MSDPHPIDCEATELFLLGDGDEQPLERVALERHLADCPRCQATAAAWQGVRESYHALDTEDVSAEAAASILAAAQQPRRERSAWHVAAAAALLLLFGGLFTWHQLDRLHDSKWQAAQIAEARQLMSLGQTDAALARLLAAGEVDSTDLVAASLYPLLAETLIQAGRPQAALDALAELWERHPTAADSLEVALATSRALDQLGQRDEALALLQRGREHFANQQALIDKRIHELESRAPDLDEAARKSLEALGYTGD